MKKQYTEPVVEITKFHTEDIITTSSADEMMSEADTPPVLDANDFLYN